jgi:DNA repair exonuclease SbcCD ATPase subunit
MDQEDKKTILFSKLDARAEQRRAQKSASEQQSSLWLTQLSELRKKIDGELQDAQEMAADASGGSDKLSGLSGLVDSFRSTLSEASSQLNTYDIQSYDKLLQEYTTSLEDLRSKFQPKKKFSFAASKQRAGAGSVRLTLSRSRHACPLIMSLLSVILGRHWQRETGQHATTATRRYAWVSRQDIRWSSWRDPEDRDIPT